jgi:CheY-like chemotaxis protein
MTTVLVVDDEAPIRLLCRVNLEAEGMRVLEASDGENGLERARTEHPDVILLDVMMPGRNGWEVAEELLSDEATSRIPISCANGKLCSELAANSFCASVISVISVTV